MAKHSLFLGSILLIMTSCWHNKQEYIVYYDKSFNEISDTAKKPNLPFCIVLFDSINFSSIEYINVLNEYKTSSNSVICNFVNIHFKGNQWYSKLLSPQIYPITCVFNRIGELIDIIPGSSKESFAYIDKVINTEEPCLEFHYNQKYDKDKIEVIRYYNSVIELKPEIDRNQYVIHKIDSILRIKEHPYLLYLRLYNLMQFNKKIEAKETAEKLLLFDSAKDLVEYYDELLIANQILDSTYNSKTAPLITSASNEIILSECDINHTYDLNVDIYNKGEKPLKISEVLTSCSCVKLVSPKKSIVNRGESMTLRIEFTPDTKGDIFREVYIVSNSLNTPIYTISINAIVR